MNEEIVLRYPTGIAQQDTDNSAEKRRVFYDCAGNTENEDVHNAAETRGNLT